MSILKRVAVSFTTLSTLVRHVSSSLAKTGAVMAATADDAAAPASLQTTIELNDGNKIPILGLGTYEANGKECTTAVGLGYRLLDTATCYSRAKRRGLAFFRAAFPPISPPPGHQVSCCRQAGLSCSSLSE